MERENRKESKHFWESTIKRYQKFIESGWKLKPMVDTVEKLSKLKLAEWTFPETSMSTLILSRFNSYVDWETGPRVHIDYNGEMGRFEVLFRYQGHFKDILENCSEIDKNVLDRIESWIDQPIS